jgi:hypothetical protein
MTNWQQFDHYVVAPDDQPLALTVRTVDTVCCIDQVEIFRYPAEND